MSGSVLVERGCHGAFVVGIAGLDVHQAYLVEETALAVIHLSVESAEFGQPFVFVDVRRHVVAGGRPVGLEHLLHDLVAHKGGVQPAPAFEEELAEVEILCHDVEPVFHFFFPGHSCCRVDTWFLLLFLYP